MAMWQRRFASSIYAVRRTLERMKEKRERILEDAVVSLDPTALREEIAELEGQIAIIEVYALQRQSWRLLTLISGGKIRSAPIS